MTHQLQQRRDQQLEGQKIHATEQALSAGTQQRGGIRNVVLSNNESQHRQQQQQPQHESALQCQPPPPPPPPQQHERQKRKLRRRRNGKVKKKECPHPLPEKGDFLALAWDLIQPAAMATQVSAAETISQPLLHRLVAVDWDNHAVLDVTCNYSDISDHQATTVATDSNKRLNRPQCTTLFIKTWEEALPSLSRVLSDKILIGHGLDAMFTKYLHSSKVAPTWARQRDLASYVPYMHETRDSLSTMLLPLSLAELTTQYLRNRKPSDNIWHRAAACLDLYKRAKSDWERDLFIAIQQKERQQMAVQSLQQQSGSLSAEENVGSNHCGRIASFTYENNYGRLESNNDRGCVPWRPTNTFHIPRCRRSSDGDGTVETLFTTDMSMSTESNEWTLRSRPESMDQRKTFNPFSSVGGDGAAHVSLNQAPPFLNNVFFSEEASSAANNVATKKSRTEVSPEVLLDSSPEVQLDSAVSLTDLETATFSAISREDHERLLGPVRCTESAHPVCEDDWLHSSKSTGRKWKFWQGKAPADSDGIPDCYEFDQEKQDDIATLIQRHLPSTLLNDSSSSEDENTEGESWQEYREESLHPVGTEDGWFHEVQTPRRQLSLPEETQREPLAGQIEFPKSLSSVQGLESGSDNAANECSHTCRSQKTQDPYIPYSPRVLGFGPVRSTLPPRDWDSRLSTHSLDVGGDSHPFDADTEEWCETGNQLRAQSMSKRNDAQSASWFRRRVAPRKLDGAGGADQELQLT